MWRDFPSMLSLEFVTDEVDLVHHGVRGRDVLLLLRHRPVKMTMMMMIMMMMMSLASSLSSSLPQTLLEPGWCNEFGSLGRKTLDCKEMFDTTGIKCLFLKLKILPL